MCTLLMLIVAILVSFTTIFAYSPEFYAIRGVKVISAVDNKPKEVTQLISECRPSESVLICFRSFG